MSRINFFMEADTVEIDGFYRDVQNMPNEVLNELRNQRKSYDSELTRMAVRRLSVYPPAWRSKQNRFKWSNNPTKNIAALLWWKNHLGVDELDSSKSYRRTGRTGKAWRVISTFQPQKDGMDINVRINNPTEGASYVYGHEPSNWFRVPSHHVTGWLSAKSSPEMNATIEDVFNITLDTVDKIIDRFDL